MIQTDEQIDELTATKEKLIKAKHLYALISQINQKIVRVKDVATLFNNACDMAIEFGKFKIAWIGVFDKELKNISLVEYCGIPAEDISLFAAAPILADDPQEYVLTTGTYYISNNIERSGVQEEWKLFAAKHNVRSLMVLPIKKAGVVIGTFNLFSEEQDFSESEEIKLLVEIAGDISYALDRFEKLKELKASEELLAKNQKKFHHVLNNMIEGAQIHDFDWRYLYVNDALVNLSTYTREELIGFTLMEKYPGVEQTEMFKTFNRCMIDRVGAKFETEFVFPNGTKKDFELSIEPIPEGIFILSIDHTKKKRAKEKLQKANRLYAFLSAINQSIVHTANEETLLNNACNIAVDIGQFVRGWIDMIDEETGKLNMKSFRGTLTSTTEAKKHSGMDYNSPLLRDTPTGRALSTGKYAVSNDVENDPAFEPWKKELIANKIKSSISLPLTKFGKVVGVFGFHSSVLNFFDDEEIALLEEAAGDVSFAMEVLEKTKIHKATEKLVVTNEKRFRALVENGADAVVILTAEGKPIYASPTVEKVLGYTEEEVMKLDIFSNIHPDDFAATANIMQQVMANPGIPIAGQTGRMMHKDGTWRWIAATVTNMLHDPAVNGIVDNFRDVTDKVNAEEQKEFDKNNTDALINNTNDLMWSVDRDYNLITANQPFEEMSKINFGRIVEKGESVITKAYTPEMTAHYKQQYDRAFTGEAYKETEHFTVPFEFWVEISYSPIRKGDEVIGTACQSRDITQIKKAEQQLQKSEAFSRGVLNSLSSHIAVVDATGNIVAVNEAWKRFALKNGETSLQRTGAGSNYFSVCEKSAAAGDETAVEVLQAMQDVLHKKKTVLYFEYPCHSPDKKRWFGMRIMKFDTDELMLVIAHLEITTRMLAEENLFKSEAQLNEAQSISQLGNWEISLPDNVVHWSNELYKIYGYTKEELQPSTETFMSLMHPDDKKSTEKKMEQDFEVFKASEMNFRFIRKDGVIRHGYAEWKFEFDKNNKPQRVFGIVQDVTEKKEAELKLIHSEQHNRALIENITDAILLTDENGNVIYQSASAERIGGFSSADMNGKNMFEFLHIDDAENWVTIFQQAYASPGVPMQNQFRILHKQGYYIWVEGTITNLLHDENVKAFIINYRDISERKQAQEKLDNTLLELEQRVEERTKDLSDKNKSITDSISYAKRIQIGLLTPHSELGRLFPKSFILSEPQHIVSGDFFWCYQKNNKKFVVVADCTGHGVPGALMSIIGNNLLNSIIVDEHIDNPSEILQMLDITLKVAVKGDRGEIKDGMDIALCVIDTYFKEVYFAGAYRPLFVSDENGLINELSGTSCSIGGGMGETGKNFETKRFPIIPGQRIYLTSDGYISQFGGPLGKKFMKKRFKIMLEEIQSLSIQEQKDSLINAFKDWSGGNEQVDDVMVVGIEL